jgi:hypothetical protein
LRRRRDHQRLRDQHGHGAATTSGSSPTSTGPDQPTGTGSRAAAGPTAPTGTTGGESTAAVGTDSEGSTTTGGESATTGVVDPDTGSSAGDESTTSTTEPVDLCKVQDEMDGMIPCTDEAPPNSFEPDIQWVWMGEGVDTQVLVTPAVANLTDDNGDGVIDLCDIPDVVVHRVRAGLLVKHSGTMYALDGATGAVHWSVPNTGAIVVPGDRRHRQRRLPEIVTARPMGEGFSPANCWCSSTTGRRSSSVKISTTRTRPRSPSPTSTPTATSRSSTTPTCSTTWRAAVAGPEQRGGLRQHGRRPRRRRRHGGAARAARVPPRRLAVL